MVIATGSLKGQSVPPHEYKNRTMNLLYGIVSRFIIVCMNLVHVQTVQHCDAQHVYSQQYKQCTVMDTVI